MTDRELLEAAAKAAGPMFVNLLSHDKWNPLADDGDALRLAVKLGIMVFSPNFNEYHGREDACPAVRRYIVTCAAALAPSATPSPDGQERM